MASNDRSGLTLVDHPYLTAAVLDSRSDQLYRALQTRDVPIVIYSGRDDVDVGAGGTVVVKPAKADEVVTAVRHLLFPNDAALQTSQLTSS
jgi:hypothetical protein